MTNVGVVVLSVVLLSTVCHAIWENVGVYNDDSCATDVGMKFGWDLLPADCMEIDCSVYPGFLAECKSNPEYPTSGGVLLKAYTDSSCSEVIAQYFWIQTGCNFGYYMKCEGDTVLAADCAYSPGCDLDQCNYTINYPVNQCDYVSDGLYATIECQSQQDNGLSAGATVGIVISVICILGAAAGGAIGAVWFFMYRKPTTYAPVSQTETSVQTAE
ncbi:hypothetical protein Pelo_18020 [Pelomyxa schiedti]|nr:hypothetical protein Pelo_18020 [Pelomyxa schiedti]